MEARVRQYFDSSPLKFVRWVDSMLLSSASIGGADKWSGNIMPRLWNEDGSRNWGDHTPDTDSAVTHEH